MIRTSNLPLPVATRKALIDYLLGPKQEYQVLTSDSSAPLGKAWKDQPGVQRFKSGRYYGPPGGLVSASSLAQGAVGATLFIVGERAQFDRAALEIVTGGGSGSLVRMGLMTDTGLCYPDRVIHDFGTVAAETNGLKEVTIDITLDAGIYWLASCCQGSATVPTIRMLAANAAAYQPPLSAGSTLQSANGGGVQSGVTVVTPILNGTILGFQMPSARASTSMPRIQLRAK